MGCGPNAIEACNALGSEEMLGFDVVAFCDEDCSEESIVGLPGD